MTRSNPGEQALAVTLAAVAGFVDVTGFLALGGFFLSFMSGNSTRLGAGMAGRLPDGLVAAGLIGTFLAGVVAGSVTGRRAGRWRRPVVLALVAALLAASACCATAGLPAAAAGAAAVLAMGAENAVLEREGGDGVSLTYMTGTLVKAGQGVARALAGGARWGWAPHALLWAGFLAGAMVGGAVFPALGLPGLAWAAAIVACLSLATAAGRWRARPAGPAATAR